MCHYRVMIKIKRQRHRFSFYIFLGAVFLLLRLIKEGIASPETFWEKSVNNIWLTIFVVVNNYILFEYTWPFIKKTWKKVFVSPLLLFVHFIAYSLGAYAWRAIGISLHAFFPLISHESIEAGATRLLSYSLGSVITFAIVSHIYGYFKLRHQAQQLTIEKQQAELNYLKSQTNPHFLFNTLNNIYALSLEKSDLAPEALLRLSKILRYMLYETVGDYVAIDKELKIIGDYIELEKLRYDDSLNVNFNYDVEDMKQAVPPLLLLPLVENAFKHGASETPKNPFVDVHLSIKNRYLKMTVKNSVRTSSNTDVSEKIGLSNLRRQLELLYSQYSLKVSEQNNMFTAALEINLSNNV